MMLNPGSMFCMLIDFTTSMSDLIGKYNPHPNNAEESDMITQDCKKVRTDHKLSMSSFGLVINAGATEPLLSRGGTRR